MCVCCVCVCSRKRRQSGIFCGFTPGNRALTLPNTNLIVLPGKKIAPSPSARNSIKRRPLQVPKSGNTGRRIKSSWPGGGGGGGRGYFFLSTAMKPVKFRIHSRPCNYICCTGPSKQPVTETSF